MLREATRKKRKRTRKPSTPSTSPARPPVAGPAPCVPSPPLLRVPLLQAPLPPKPPPSTPRIHRRGLLGGLAGRSAGALGGRRGRKECALPPGSSSLRGRLRDDEELNGGGGGDGGELYASRKAWKSSVDCYTAALSEKREGGQGRTVVCSAPLPSRTPFLPSAGSQEGAFASTGSQDCSETRPSRNERCRVDILLLFSRVRRKREKDKVVPSFAVVQKAQNSRNQVV